MTLAVARDMKPFCFTEYSGLSTELICYLVMSNTLNRLGILLHIIHISSPPSIYLISKVERFFFIGFSEKKRGINRFNIPSWLLKTKLLDCNFLIFGPIFKMFT